MAMKQWAPSEFNVLNQTYKWNPLNQGSGFTCYTLYLLYSFRSDESASNFEVYKGFQMIFTRIDSGFPTQES